MPPLQKLDLDISNVGCLLLIVGVLAVCAGQTLGGLAVLVGAAMVGYAAGKKMLS